MGEFLKKAAIGLLIGMWVTMSAAEEIAAKETNKEQITEQLKALDEQVQEIKKDVLDISNNLIQLDEKLIYPPNTQIAIFLAVPEGEQFRLETIKIKIDGKEAANHLYTSQEVDALQHRGVQRIYTGNIRNGEHALEVALTGKSAGNDDYQRNANHKFTKDAGTKLIEVTLAGPASGNQSITFRD